MGALTSPFARLKASMGPLVPQPEPADISPYGLDQAAIPAFPSTSAPKVNLAKFDPETATPEELATHPLVSRLRSDESKDLHPWGTPENHPGFLGKLGHALSVATGGPNRRMYEEMGLQKSLRDLLKEQSTENEQGANAAHLMEETAEMPSKTASEEGLQGAQTKNLESETRERDLNASYGPSLAVAYSHAVNSAMQAGRDPATDPIVQHLGDAITSIQKQTAPKGAHFIQREVGGKPHTIAVDDVTGQDIRDEGETGEKPPTVNVNAGEASLDREASRLAKPYEKGVSDADAQLEKIADARNMVNGNAESQALGIPKVLTALVSGQGSGVRITQPELNMIARARGLSGDIEGTLNKWAGKGQLTTAQKQQLTAILDDVRNRLIKKQAIHSAALDSINGAATRADVQKADKLARQQMNEVEQYGFYTGEKLPTGGTVVGFKGGKIQVDDAR